MSESSDQISERVSVDRGGLQAVFDALLDEGYALMGPRVRDGAIVLDPITRVDDLPVGVTDEQAPGRYRLHNRGDAALFGYAASPHSAKRELLVPRTALVRIRKRDRALELQPIATPERKLALIGVRACELAAIAIQDRVLASGTREDADYRARRAQLFTMVVQCSDPAGTCFCVSMSTGPRAHSGFDLAATELLQPEHLFVFEVGSARGAALLARVPSRPASQEEIDASLRVSAEASTRMGRQLETADLPAKLMQQLEHPRWDQVADRCLGCANCTLVCPTCFCTTVEDVTDLSGELATRERRWDSCFNADFAYIAGGSARPTLRSRYRQWLTHKLAT